MNEKLSRSEIEILSGYRINVPVKRRRAYDKYCAMAHSGNVLDGWFALELDVRERPLSPPQSMYDPLRQALKRNLPPEMGDEIVEKIKADKATNRDGFIKRHGADKGHDMFKKFQDTSRTAWENLVSDVGLDAAKMKFKKLSPRSKHFFMEFGYSEEDSMEMASCYQKTNSGLFPEYYISNGTGDYDASLILADINKRKVSASYQRYQDLYPDSWRERMDDVIKKRRRSLGLPDLTPAMLSLKEDYYREVDKHTRASVALYGHMIENLELRGRRHDHDLDHVYSKNDGFRDGVPPEIIGHWTNLRVLNAPTNRSKRGRSDITLDELYERYELENQKN